jgi:hypothetical protein
VRAKNTVVIFIPLGSVQSLTMEDELKSSTSADMVSAVIGVNRWKMGTNLRRT